MSKRYALLTDGVVTNIVEQDDLPPAEFNPVVTDVANVGWTYNGVDFIDTTPKPVPPTPNELILQSIAQLESTVTPRRIREATLTIEGKLWLENVDAQITALRGSLV